MKAIIKDYKKSPQDTEFYRLVIYQTNIHNTKIYSQETVRIVDGKETVVKGTKGIQKILYSFDRIKNAASVVYLMSEEDADYFNRNFPETVFATTSIGYPRQKLAPYLWRYYVQDLQGKNLGFIARSDAEEKQFLLLIRNLKLYDLCPTVWILNVVSLKMQDYTNRKYRLRIFFSAFLSTEISRTLHQLGYRCDRETIEKRLTELNQYLIPEEFSLSIPLHGADGQKYYMRFGLGLRNVEELSKSAKQILQKELKKEKKQLEKEKKNRKQVVRDNATQDRITKIIMQHFPPGYSGWRISNVDLCTLLNQQGIEMTPKKLGLVLDQKIIRKKYISNGKTSWILKKVGKD